MSFDIKFDELMSKHTSFKVGGPAKHYAAPKNLTELAGIIKYAHKIGKPYIAIGRGTNLLVTDKGIDAVVIDMSGFNNCMEIISENRIRAGAGVKLAALCRFAIKNSLKGMNFALGIPGTVGGAVMTNAGTPLGNIGDIIESVTVIKKDIAIEKIDKKRIKFSYRDAVFDIKDTLIIEVELLLNNTEKRDILKKEALNIIRDRKKKQPLNIPSAGSFFKNPQKGKTAGELIDLAGLKGRGIGKAKISEKHANFIVNTGNSAADILALKEVVQKEVFKKFGVKLTPEVKIVGN